MLNSEKNWEWRVLIQKDNGTGWRGRIRMLLFLNLVFCWRRRDWPRLSLNQSNNEILSLVRFFTCFSTVKKRETFSFCFVAQKHVNKKDQVKWPRMRMWEHCLLVLKMRRDPDTIN